MVINTIKKTFFLTLFCLFFFTKSTFAQGKFAGDFKGIIGSKFVNHKDIPQLKNFNYVGGSIISDLVVIDSYYLSLEVYRKGNTAIVIMTKLVDQTTKLYRIIEVLKINDVPQNYEIRISGCSSKNTNPDDKIVAVYYIGNKKSVKLIKEVFVLKDIRFEKMNPKNVKCINEI